MPELASWSVDVEKAVAAELATRPPRFRGDGSRPVWSIDTPPPYPSGRWHIGAVAGYSLIDVIARSRRMMGYDVLFPWGTDRNGINIEFAIEKKHRRRMQDWVREMGPVEGRAAFNAACEEAISEFSDDMVRIGQRIGLSCDFENGYTTDSPSYRAFSQSQFLRLFMDKQVVEDLRPNTYDPKLGTAIADAEVYYEERKTKLHDITWTVRETGEPITVATTRPELICACRAVLVHPDNEATRHLIGKTAVLPVARGRDLPAEVPIRAHPHVKTDFGSGIMMVCSYGDQADVQLFRELQLEPIAAIGLDGAMTDAAGPYAGLPVEEARSKVVEDLEQAGKVSGHTVIDQKFPISERSKAAIEIILLREWYVRQTHCTDELRRVAHEIDFTPSKHRQLLLDWIDTVSIDWPISRRRFYHTEIPLWLTIDDAGEELPYVVVPPFDADAKQHAYHQPWRSGPPEGSRLVHRDTREDLGDIVHIEAKPAGATAPMPLGFLIGTTKGNMWAVGESKVFDTWMDSSVSNLFILKDHRDTTWGKDHVCSVRPQGRDIVRTWLYYTVLKTWLLRGGAAFENAWIHGMGMDKHGRKMSKSLGNVINPDEILEKAGSDAFRLWIAGECTIGDDFRVNIEKIQGSGKFLQKLGNVARFVARFERPAERPASLHPVDEWILAELDTVVRRSVAAYEALDFFTPANEVRNFVWNLFAPHYVEMVKGRAYGPKDGTGDPAALWTLHHVVEAVLRLLAPICPLFAHHVAQGIHDLDVHEATFPEPLGVTAHPMWTDPIVAFNSEVWKRKKDAGLSLAAPIEGIDVPAELAPIADVLTEMHKLATVEKPAATGSGKA